MAPMSPVIDDRLISIDSNDNISLLAARDLQSGRLVFPVAGELDPHTHKSVTLPREGTLWSWTVQRFPPKSPPYEGPAQFKPYAVGYVALGDALIVEGRLTGAPIDQFVIGMPMMLVSEQFTIRGENYTTFAFAPTGDPAA